MKRIFYLAFSLIVATFTACGSDSSKTTTEAHASSLTNETTTAAEPEKETPESQPDSSQTAEDSFHDDIDFDWNGQVSHDIYDDYSYEQLMSDPEIDELITNADRKYYNEKKVEKIVQKEQDNATFTMDEYKEVIQELKAISIYDILWARSKLEVEHLKSTGEMAADDYHQPDTPTQKAFKNLEKRANHGLLDVESNISSMLDLLRAADLDLEAKKDFYIAKKLRAYYGKVLETSNDLCMKRSGF